MADEEPTLLALAADANDEIVHRRRCGKAPDGTDKPRDSEPQRDIYIYSRFAAYVPGTRDVARG